MTEWASAKLPEGMFLRSSGVVHMGVPMIRIELRAKTWYGSRRVDYRVHYIDASGQTTIDQQVSEAARRLMDEYTEFWTSMRMMKELNDEKR